MDKSRDENDTGSEIELHSKSIGFDEMHSEWNGEGIRVKNDVDVRVEEAGLR